MQFALLHLFVPALLLLSSPTTISASAVPDDDAADLSPSSLEKRASCVVYRGETGLNRFEGRCVDTRRAKPCEGGVLITGKCDGPNYVICCVKHQCFSETCGVYPKDLFI